MDKCRRGDHSKSYRKTISVGRVCYDLRIISRFSSEDFPTFGFDFEYYNEFEVDDFVNSSIQLIPVSSRRNTMAWTTPPKVMKYEVDDITFTYSLLWNGVPLL